MKKIIITFILLLMISSAAFANINVALLSTNNGTDNQLFWDECSKGIASANSKLRKKVSAKIFSVQEYGSAKKAFEQAAMKNNLVIVPVDDFQPYLAEMVRKYPHVTFVAFFRTEVPTVKEVILSPQQTAFMAGAIAACSLKISGNSKFPDLSKIAIICGDNREQNKILNDSFSAGSWYIDRAISTLSKAGADTKEKYAEFVRELHKNGVSVLFIPAGKNSAAAVEVATKEKMYVITDDADLEKRFPDTALPGIHKKMDVLVYDTILSFLKKDIAMTQTLGFSYNMLEVSLAIMQNKIFSKEIRKKILETAAKLRYGLIILPEAK